jgi:uncharacterized protein (DUF2225 family)
MRKIIIIVVFIIAIANTISATTWYPENKKCPLCGVTSKYMSIGSYGSYIYSWPSRLQLVFWPSIDQAALYCCPKCKYSVFMWDFDTVPGQHRDSLTAFLKTVSFDKKYKGYSEIPLVKRLEIAEQVYMILTQDNETWCWFYRVAGYILEEEKEEYKAFESRKKALLFLKQMMSEPGSAGKQKEHFFIQASMFYFTHQHDSAMMSLNNAMLFPYENETISLEEQENYNYYLDELIQDLKELVLEKIN